MSMATAPYLFPNTDAATCPPPFPYTFCPYPAPPPGFVPGPAYTPPPVPAYAPPPPFPYPPPSQAYSQSGYYPAAATPSTASVYMPASGFSPNWPPPVSPFPPTAPPPSLSPTESTFPTTAFSQMQPDPAPLPGCFQAPAYGTPPAWPYAAGAATYPSPTSGSASPAPIRERPQPQPAFQTSASRMQRDSTHAAIDALTPLLELQQEEGMKTKDGATPRYDYATTGSDALPVLPDYTCQGRGLTKRNSTSSSEILSVPEPSPAFDLEKRNSTSSSDHRFVTLQATTAPTPVFSFASSSASSDTGATASSSASSLNSYFGESCAAPTPVCDSVSVTRPSAVSSTMAYVAPLVFGEMPQPYGFSNLDRRSVFRADGTERRYYVLPEIFSLQQATSSVSHAIPTVEGSGNSQSSTPPVNEQNSEKQTHHSQDNQSILDMLAQAKTQLETISEKLRYAIMQNSRETTLDCIKKKAASKPHLAREDINLNCPSHQAVLEPECVVGNEETEDCSNQLVQVFKSTPEQQRYAAEQHESRQAPKCFSMPIFSPERPTVDDIDQLLNCPCRASECRTWDEESQGDANLLWEKSVCQTATAHPILFFLWDPGDTKFQTLVLTATDATKRQRTYVYKFGLTQILAVQFGVRRHSISIFPWDPGATEFPFLFMTSAGATELHGTNVFKSAFTCSCETQTPKLLNFLVNLKKTIPWPSGKLQLITPFKLFMELLCANPAVQVTQQLHHLEFLVMAELSLNVNKVDGQLTYKHKVSCFLQIVLACPYSVPACYSSMFSSAEATHYARSLSAATTMCVTLVLSSDEIAEEGKDAADMYKIPEIQLPLRKTSHVCYPGGESILYSYKGLHVHKTQLVDCTSTATHACYLVPAHTPPTQISTQACSNTELGELISRCLVYHQHQITNWTSAADNVIRSFEYAYTLHFLIDQWEFFHQLCVQKNYSAKNLLPSPNYLQLLDLDIVFITFLPP